MNATAIGLSALATAQQALDVVSHNIANAATPGYRRQSVCLVDRVYDGIHGVGVEVGAIVQAQDQLLRSAVLAAASNQSMYSVRLDVESQVESAYTTAGIDTRIAGLFDKFTRLSARPEDLTLRRGVLAEAASLAGAIRNLTSQLSEMQQSIARSLADGVAEANRITSEIARLNERIGAIEASGNAANDLRDRRDLLIQDLAEWMNVRSIEQDRGMVTVIGASSPLVVGATAQAIQVDADPAGNRFIYSSSPSQPLAVEGGKLAGLLQEHNQFLNGYLDGLDELAIGLMRSLDGIQATGLGTSGPFLALAGQRSVANDSVPLDSAGLAIVPQAGTLFIGVTDLGSSQRSLFSASIDPTTMSLQDVATAITSATAGAVQASVNGSLGTLEFQAAPGFAFDFSGRMPSIPDSVAMGGTSVPSVSGTFMGASNDTFSFSVVGVGTVGVTPGLTLEVRNGASALIGSYDIGAGYQPDSTFPIGDGVVVRLSAGTTNNGTFQARMVAEPDDGGLLAALGVNALFSGVSAASIDVNPDLAGRPSALSASRSGDAADGRNLERFLAQSGAPLLANGTRTFHQFVLDALGGIGQEVSFLDVSREAVESLHSSLVQQEQGIVGVDVNEEMVRLVEFQRMIEANSRVLSVANQALEAILDIVR